MLEILFQRQDEGGFQCKRTQTTSIATYVMQDHENNVSYITFIVRFFSSDYFESMAKSFEKSAANQKFYEDKPRRYKLARNI